MVCISTNMQIHFVCTGLGFTMSPSSLLAVAHTAQQQKIKDRLPDASMHLIHLCACGSHSQGHYTFRLHPKLLQCSESGLD